MTVWQLIRSLAQRGYALQTGQHWFPLRGYYACFYKPDAIHRCEECGSPLTDDWNECGHGQTLSRAIIMAAKLVLSGERSKVTIPPVAEFK